MRSGNLFKPKSAHSDKQVIKMYTMQWNYEQNGESDGCVADIFVRW